MLNNTLKNKEKQRDKALGLPKACCDGPWQRGLPALRGSWGPLHSAASWAAADSQDIPGAQGMLPVHTAHTHLPAGTEHTSTKGARGSQTPTGRAEGQGTCWESHGSPSPPTAPSVVYL